MSKFHCEMFGHFIYDEHLTYQELLDVEAQLIGNTQILLENLRAEHIHFSPLGDELMLQCAFDDYDGEHFQDICEALRPCLHPSVDARLLFVDKHLSGLRIYYINHRAWREEQIPLLSTQEALNKPTPKGKRTARTADDSQENLDSGPSAH